MTAPLEALADAVASSAGGIVSAVVPYPIEIVKNRVAVADQGDGTSVLAVVKDIWQKGGPLGFYQGVTVSAGGNAIEKFIYFFAYSSLRSTMTNGGTKTSAWRDVLAGALADMCHMPVTLPTDTLLIRIVNEADPSKSPLQVAREVVQEKGGFLGFYRGIMAMLILTIKPGLQLAIFEGVKGRLLRLRAGAGGPASGALSGLEAFMLGALARAVATVIVFPYIRGKVLLQRGRQAQGNALAALHRVMFRHAQENGILSLYQSMPQELARATLSAALMFAVRERLTVRVKSAVLGLRT